MMIPPGHMQKVNRSRRARLDVQAVLRRAQRGVIGKSPVAGHVHVLLRLLDPDPELERLRLQGDPPPEEHPVGVPRAVADRQDGQVGRPRSPSWSSAPSDAAVGDVEVFHPAGEPDLAAQRLELPAEGPDDQGEAVRTQVRLGLVDDGRLAVAVGEDLEDLDGRRGRCSDWSACRRRRSRPPPRRTGSCSRGRAGRRCRTGGRRRPGP